MASEKKQKKQKGSFFGFGKMTKDMGIDLGTANTLVYIKGQGIVLREPSVVAIRDDSKDVLAVGEEAKRMIGRTPGNIKAIRPMKDGVIADFDITQSMLTYFIQKSAAKKGVVSARIAICVPYGVTEVEKKAIEEAAQQAGAKEVFLIEEPMAAAVGANLDIAEPSGNIVVDIGGGTTEVAVISLGGVVVSTSLRTAGDELDEDIVNFVKKEMNLSIGETTAEKIKMQIGCAMPLVTDISMEIRGRDLTTGLPKNVIIYSSQIQSAIEESIKEIVEAVKQTLEKTPPELASDIMEKGIVLTGGGALIQNLDKLISKSTGMPVYIAETPLNCVAIGAGKTIDDLEKLKTILVNSRRR